MTKYSILVLSLVLSKCTDKHTLNRRGETIKGLLFPTEAKNYKSNYFIYIASKVIIKKAIGVPMAGSHLEMITSALFH